ncbi:MAG: substrate-binding domain-containing protein [Propionibacteriaceae bacterium]|nr:substrate-binding domain-containing protein [Propionibacteriaceae bacterium]
MGLIVPNLTNPFFGAVAQAAAASLTQQGWHLLMADLDDRPGREAEQAEWLRSYRVDAVLMIPVSLQAPDGLSRVTCPLVQIDRWVPVPDSVIVRTDDHEGVRLLVDHLRATGRHRLAFIGADPTSSSARLRLDSFREYAGMGRPVLLGDYSAQWGRRAAEVLLETVGDTDAVVCANDLIALGVIQVLIENGLRVPADLAVTGFDDIVFAELSHPALTTIRQPVAQLASAAVEAAMTLIRGEDLEHRDLVLPPELVVRGSAPGGS